MCARTAGTCTTRRRPSRMCPTNTTAPVSASPSSCRPLHRNVDCSWHCFVLMKYFPNVCGGIGDFVCAECSAPKMRFTMANASVEEMLDTTKEDDAVSRGSGEKSGSPPSQN